MFLAPFSVWTIWILLMCMNFVYREISARRVVRNIQLNVIIKYIDYVEVK
jgi:hypothetical protein